jgi:excisionase family DNA binding protein
MIYQTTHSNKPEAPHFLTVKEAAAYLRLCDKQVRRLIARGELPAHRFGRALRIGKDDIEAYVASRRLFPVKNK